MSFNSFGYVLTHRPFRENSLIVDLFTQDYGRICCLARPAKKRGKVLKANLEAFRYLQLQWLGKGDMQTLIEADERGRHDIPAAQMMMGLYINELLLQLLHPHIAMPELFSAYKYTLHKLSDPSINKQIMMQFELYLLSSLDHPIGVNSIAMTEPCKTEKTYQFDMKEGLIPVAQNVHSDNINVASSTAKISGELLLALQDIQNMQESQWQALRVFLDQVFQSLAPRPLHARTLLRL